MDKEKKEERGKANKKGRRNRRGGNTFDFVYVAMFENNFCLKNLLSASSQGSETSSLEGFIHQMPIRPSFKLMGGSRDNIGCGGSESISVLAHWPAGQGKSSASSPRHLISSFPGSSRRLKECLSNSWSISTM